MPFKRIGCIQAGQYFAGNVVFHFPSGDAQCCFLLLELLTSRDFNKEMTIFVPRDHSAVPTQATGSGLSPLERMGRCRDWATHLVLARKLAEPRGSFRSLLEKRTF